jgi:hypothetical protein
MVRVAVLGLSLIVVGIDAGRAQDIAGIEDCTKTSGLDKRTGCLQSNVNFLQRVVTKIALETSQKLNAADAEIVAAQKRRGEAAKDRGATSGRAEGGR